MKFIILAVLAIVPLMSSASPNGEWIAEGKIRVDADVDSEYMAKAFEAKRYLKHSKDRDIAKKCEYSTLRDIMV